LKNQQKKTNDQRYDGRYFNNRPRNFCPTLSVASSSLPPLLPPVLYVSCISTALNGTEVNELRVMTIQ